MKIIRPINITTSGTFTRDSVGTYFDKAGVMQTAGFNVPRIDYDPITHEMKGVLVEPTKTNFARLSGDFVTYISSDTNAGTFTLSFYGTGTITLSGTATGVVTGSGAFPVRKTYTFTKTAGTLNMLKSGDVQHVQLESGSAATSYIPINFAYDTGIRAADVVTGSGFIYSNVTEADYSEWDSSASYTATVGAVIGSRVIRSTTHKVYECFISGVNTTPPENDTSGRWLEVGPTNRWAVFDASMSTATSNSNTITYIIKPGRVNGLAILGMNATFVEVAMTANGETVYSGSADLLSGNIVGDWYQYFYEPIYQRDALVITELIDSALLNLPAYGDGLISITIEYPTNTPSAAAIVTGLVADFGLTQYDTSVGIIDYSKVETDSFGKTNVVKRGFSKRATFDLVIRNDAVDNVAKILSLYRATPIVWVGTDNIHNSLVVYGFYKDWEITFTEPTVSRINLQVEGLSQ